MVKLIESAANLFHHTNKYDLFSMTVITLEFQLTEHL